MGKEVQSRPSLLRALGYLIGGLCLLAIAVYWFHTWDTTEVSYPGEYHVVERVDDEGNKTWEIEDGKGRRRGGHRGIALPAAFGLILIWRAMVQIAAWRKRRSSSFVGDRPGAT